MRTQFHLFSLIFTYRERFFIAEKNKNGLEGEHVQSQSEAPSVVRMRDVVRMELTNDVKQSMESVFAPSRSWSHYQTAPKANSPQSESLILLRTCWHLPSKISNGSECGIRPVPENVR